MKEHVQLLNRSHVIHVENHSLDREISMVTKGKSFAQSSYLKRHGMVHTGVKPFTCDMCGKSFTQSGDLKRHEMVHTGVKPFTCDICEQSFTQSGHLKRHEMVHTGVKPFTCDICGKSFSQSGVLKIHELVHTGVKHFTCDICEKSFAESGHLKRHEIVHTGVRPFTCDICGKSFTRSGELERHEIVHTGVKPFICDTCGELFSRSENQKTQNDAYSQVITFHMSNMLTIIHSIGKAQSIRKQNIQAGVNLSRVKIIHWFIHIVSATAFIHRTARSSIPAISSMFGLSPEMSAACHNVAEITCGRAAHTVFALSVTPQMLRCRGGSVS